MKRLQFVEKFFLVQIYPLVWIAHILQKSFEIFTLHDERGSVLAWVEAHSLGILQLLVQEKMHVVFRVVDESERRHRTGFHAEVLHQTRLRGEAQLALVQLFFNVVDIHVLVAIETDQIVLVALVVAEEKVLAMLGIVPRPILLSYLDSRCWRMLQIFVWNMQFIQ